MPSDFDKILDECIDRLNRGESIEACVSRCPEHADELRPLLSAMVKAVDCYKFEPSASAKLAAKRRFQSALDTVERKQEKKSFWLFGQPRVWATRDGKGRKELKLLPRDEILKIYENT